MASTGCRFAIPKEMLAGCHLATWLS